MTKEYKFMFDRRFDEPEEENSAVKEDMSTKSVDGIPSISELLDTINTQIEQSALKDQLEEEEQPQQKQSDQDVSATPDGEGEAFISQESTAATGVEELQANVQSVQNTLEQKIEPVFTQQEMDQAKQQSKEEGRLQGLEEGREAAWQEAMVSIEKQNSDLLSVIENAISKVLEQSQNDSQTAFTTAVDFAMAVCKKVVPTLSAKNAIEEIQGLLEKNFHFLKEEPKITLRLNSFSADKIKPVLADLVKKESYAGKIAVIRDNTLPLGDCLVEWKNGGLQRNTQDILNQTEELIKLYAQAAPQTEPAEQKSGVK